jgi:ATP-dependent DNA helicase DinG
MMTSATLRDRAGGGGDSDNGDWDSAIRRSGAPGST